MADFLSSMINNNLFNRKSTPKSIIPLQEKKATPPDDEDISGDSEDYSLPDDEEIATDETDSEDGGDYSLPEDETDEMDDENEEGDDTADDDDLDDDTADTDETTEDDSIEGDENEEGASSYSLDDNPESTENDSTTDEGEDSQDYSTEGGEGDTSQDDPVLLGKKLKLIEAMSKLYNSISTVLVELNIISPNTKEEREIYNTIVDTLNDTREMIYSYILLKYPKATYEQNLMAYYSFEASIEICRGLLGKMKELRNPKQ